MFTGYCIPQLGFPIVFVLARMPYRTEGVKPSLLYKGLPLMFWEPDENCQVFNHIPKLFKKLFYKKAMCFLVFGT